MPCVPQPQSASKQSLLLLLLCLNIIIITNVTLTDHAGPHRCECHPGTNFWHPCKFLKNKTVTRTIFNNFRFVIFHRIMINIIFFGLTKTGAKTAPRVPKLDYFDGRVPKVSSRVTLATSGAGVVCQMYIRNYNNIVQNGYLQYRDEPLHITQIYFFKYNIWPTNIQIF